jgi:hypothetical protein
LEEALLFWGPCQETRLGVTGRQRGGGATPLLVLGSYVACRPRMNVDIHCPCIHHRSGPSCRRWWELHQPQGSQSEGVTVGCICFLVLVRWCVSGWVSMTTCAAAAMLQHHRIWTGDPTDYLQHCRVRQMALPHWMTHSAVSSCCT